MGSCCNGRNDALDQPSQKPKIDNSNNNLNS